MNFLQLFKKAFERVIRDSGVFDVPVSAQKAFLDGLPAPKDDIQRSYLQYRCQARLMKRGLPFLLNCAAMPLLPLYSLKLRRHSGSSSEPEQQDDAVLIFAGPQSIVPDSLRREFQITQVKDFQQHQQLDCKDIAYLRELRKRYPFAFYFRFKCMMKVAMYSYVISHHGPRAVICSEEYSFTSSLLTDYCRQRHVAHINIMHGEKLFDITDSFFHFDRFFVWDHFYIDLFCDLRAENSQFVTEIPPSLCFSGQDSQLESVDYTYYLGNESPAQIDAILKSLSVLRDRGARVALRPHPIYHDHSYFLFEDTHGFLIERAAEISIEDSLLRTGCAVSLYSTVLLQAACNGIPFVIDDVSDPEKYRQLGELRFICLNKEHRLLSELLK